MEGRGWDFLETEEGSLAGQLTVSTQRPSLGTGCMLPQQPEQRGKESVTPAISTVHLACLCPAASLSPVTEEGRSTMCLGSEAGR